MSTEALVDNVGMPAQDLYELLNARRRRLAIVELARLDRPVDASELAREIANRHDVGEGATSARKRVLISLHQNNLRDLEDAGLVSVDATNTVTPRPDIRTVADVIKAVDMVCNQEVDVR